jgi:hypothetical protein
MNKEKKDFSKWWLLISVLSALSVVMLLGLNYAGNFTGTILERKVFENSYQRSEGLKSQIATYKAQIASLKVQLTNPNLDDETKVNINAQLAGIRIQLQTAKGMK